MNINLSHKTVAQLRQENYRVRVIHYRHLKHDDGERVMFVPLYEIQNRSKCLPHGGKTEIFVTAPDGKEFFGHAGCVLTDPFNRKMGVQIALGRLIELQPGQQPPVYKTSH